MFFFRSRTDQSPRKRVCGVRRPLPFRRPLSLERLEDRTVLSTINWIAGNGDWDNGANWSGGKVPGAGDVAVLNTTSPATITISSTGNESIGSLMLGSKATLAINGGSLALAATSTLAGSLSMSEGSLTASGTGTTVTVTGVTNIFGGSLYAEGGAVLSLPTMTSYTSDNSIFQADGTGSVLDVSALTTVTQKSFWSIFATHGGEINLSGVTGLQGPVNLQFGFNLTDTGNSTILDGNLKSLDLINVTLDGTDALVAQSWTRFSNSFLTLTGGSYNLPSLTDVDGSGFSAKPVPIWLCRD